MLYILISIFLWSSLGIVIKLSGMPVHILIFFSAVISAIITTFLLTKKEYRQEISKGRAISYLLILGPVSLLNTFTFFYAYKYTTIANAVLTHYTAPVIVAFLAPIFLKEKLTIKILLAIAIASIGLCIMLDISVKEFFDQLAAGDKNTAGIFAGLFSGLAYAVLIIVLRVFAQNFNPIIMLFSQNFVIAAMLLPFVEIPDGFSGALWAIAVMGIIHSTIAPILYFKGIKEVPANKTAILGYIEPVFAIILGMIFLGELINYKIVIGGAMILFSGYLAIKG